ncbi:hypothetical protein [Phenylobacterium sp.]|uniref:hypothetical protein n=1 Tax=Phenylobacterium sp. TaxID=1871053 RepID=UPI0039830AF6
MCVDTDEETRTKVTNFSSYGYGYNFGDAMNNPGGTFVTVSEVVVEASAPKPVEIVTRGPIALDVVFVRHMPFAVLGAVGWLDNINVPAEPTPCVSAAPAGTTIDAVNRHARYVGDSLAVLHANTGNEYSALIYRLADGSLHQTTPFTTNEPGRVGATTLQTPAGSTVVARVHTHSYSATGQQAWLSAADRQMVRDLIADATLRGLNEVDPNMLSYIATRHPSGDNQTWVYDKNNLDQEGPSCNVQGTPPV